MKKSALFLLVTILFKLTASAQINWGNYSQSYPDTINKSRSAIGLIVAIPKDNNSFWVDNDNDRYFSRLNSDSSFRHNRPKDIIARTTFDTAAIHYFLHGVNKNNAGAYQFRITLYPSGRILKPWQPINNFSDAKVIKDSALPQMAYLGGYAAIPGNVMVLDVSEKGSNKIVATSAVALEPIKPVITNVYSSDNIDAFLQKLQYPWVRDTISDKLPANPFTLPATNKNIVFLLKANIYRKEQVQYQLTRNGDIYTPWRSNDYDNSFVWIKECPPGNYSIQIRYVAQPQHIATYSFKIMPAWYQSTVFRIIAGIILAMFLGVFLFMALFIKEKQKAKHELAKKTKLQLELKAIYSQLNPHFVFNALSSIQGLINKRDIDGANRYLSDFAKLMRESLNRSTKD